MIRKRETAIELFRSLLMLSIVMCHACGNFYPHGSGGFFGAAVVGFVFISGWFGIRFTWGKVMRLVLTAAYCMAVSMLVGQLLVGADYGIASYLRVFKRIQIYWFLWAYVALMFISPAIEFVFKYAREHRESPIRIFAPFLFMIYCWSYLQHIPQFREYLPKIEGFDSLSVFSLSAAYIVARLCRYYDIRQRVWKLPHGNVLLVATWLVSAALVFVGFYHHHSLASIFLNVSAFFLITKLRVPDSIGRFLLWISPSLFSVYLMHCRCDGVEVLERITNSLSSVGVPSMLSCLVSALVVMTGCIVLDLPRRVLFFACDYVLKRRQGAK